MRDDEELRVEVYRRFAETGSAGTVASLAESCGASADEVAASLERLAAARHVVLVGDRIVLAHPFATRDFGFSVKSDTTLWWGGCAWDAFAIPHLVPASSPALVATTCPACGAAHAWSVGVDAPPDGDQVAHFLVPMAHVWDDVVHACEHQRIFCDRGCVASWLERSGHDQGSVFDIGALWRLASGWYAGRLERGYRRREPAEAVAYFRGAGLVGPFWGS